MSQATSLPIPGQIARIRQRTYLVEEVVKAKQVADSTLVRLSCVDDDNQGQPLEVLWEKELGPTILTGEAWESVAKKGFDDSRLFAAYLNTLKWNCVTSTDPRLFQSPFRAGIRLDAYQLEPLRRALRMPRVNLFIADDVGLGKTIEAGLIARELLLRKKSPRNLRVLPSFHVASVARGNVFSVWPDLRDSRQRLHEKGPSRAWLQREPLDYAQPLSRLPPAVD